MPRVVERMRVDLAGRRAFRGNQELRLSHKEFDLLSELMRNQGAVPPVSNAQPWVALRGEAGINQLCGLTGYQLPVPSESLKKLYKNKAEYQAKAEKLKDMSITIAAKVHDGEKLFGSIHAADIAAKLRETGYEFDKKAVLLPEPIKQLGMYTIKLQLHKEVETKVKLWVISDESK